MQRFSTAFEHATLRVLSTRREYYEYTRRYVLAPFFRAELINFAKHTIQQHRLSLLPLFFVFYFGVTRAREERLSFFFFSAVCIKYVLINST